jgi:hypothetical protein
MEPSDADSSPVLTARSDHALGASARAPAGTPKVRRLIADQRYFGLDAQTFHRGAERMLERVTAQEPGPARIDVHGLGEDFRLDGAAGWTLLRAMLAGGLLLADGPGSYRVTARFREYATAPVIMPLSRESARDLIERAREAAARINAHPGKNPYRIRSILVAGSYMSRSSRVPELSLWLLLRRRPEPASRHWSAPLSKSDAMRQLVTTMKALSTFIIVHLVSDRQDVPRPFSVVYDADEELDHASGPSSWGRFREWGASISRRLSLK